MSKILEEINNNINSQTQNNPPTEQEPSLMNIIISSLTPLIPVVLAKFTGQKLPVANLTSQQDPIDKLVPILQSMINTQNILLQEVSLLRNNSQNIANSFQTLRLTHEKKQIDFNANQNLENHE